MIKNIFFDFDGVLVDSVSVKTEAFRKLYAFAGEEVAAEVVAYHLANGGVSRFEKIKYWHHKHLGIHLSENEINEWANQFSALALQGVLDAEEVQGAYQFLENNSQQYNCWIITGTPTEEINEIIQLKKWDKYFKQACGSPQKKTYWTEYLIEKHQLNRSETVFIGDALADYEASEKAQLHFILRETPENKHLFSFYKGLSLPNLTNLQTVLNTL